jgi:hypothetical protein
MVFEKMLRMSKVLSLLIAITFIGVATNSYGQDSTTPPANALICRGEMIRLGLEREEKIQMDKPLELLIETPANQLSLKKKSDFSVIDARIEYFTNHKEAITPDQIDLQNKMLQGHYDISQWVTQVLLGNPSATENWNSLREKNGIKIVKSKRGRLENVVQFLTPKPVGSFIRSFLPNGQTLYEFWRSRVYANRSWNWSLGYVLGYYQINLPATLQSTTNPELELAKLNLSFVDALEKANAGSENILSFGIRSLGNSLKAFSMAGLDSFQNIFIISLRGLGVTKKESIPVLLNLSARLYTKDSTRKKMLLTLIKNIKNPEFISSGALELSVDEKIIFDSEGPEGLVKYMITRRGTHETTRFVHYLVTTVIPLYFFIRQAGDVIHRQVPNGKPVAGVCDPHSNARDLEMTREAGPAPFDPEFRAAPLDPKFGKINPCDPDRSIDNEFQQVLKTYAQSGLTEAQVRARWNANNLASLDTDVKLQGDILMDKIRSKYNNVNTGCCQYVQWYHDHANDY